MKSFIEEVSSAASSDNDNDEEFLPEQQIQETQETAKLRRSKRKKTFKQAFPLLKIDCIPSRKKRRGSPKKKKKADYMRLPNNGTKDYVKKRNIEKKQIFKR